MIGLRIPPLTSRKHLGSDLAFPPLLIDLLRDILCNPLLVIIVIEYGTPVLRSDIGALTVRGGRIVHLVEELDELVVCDFLGIVDDLKSFGVCIELVYIPNVAI